MEQFDLFSKPERTSKEGSGGFIDKRVSYLPFDIKNQTETVYQAQRRLAAFMQEGSSCPCCGKNVQFRFDSLNRSVVKPIIWMVENRCRVLSFDGRPKLEHSSWVSFHSDAPKEFRKSRHYTRAKHWGLIEKREESTIEGSLTSSVWRVTQRGFDFVSGRIALPKKAVVYNDKVRGFEGELIEIGDALDYEFSLAESIGMKVTNSLNEYA